MLDEYAILFLNIKKDSAKAFLPSTLSFRLCNAHKLYFNVVFKLLPYVALANRRSLFVCLTEKAKKAAEDMSAIFERADQQAACALSEENLEQLKSFLYIICDSLAHESEA